MKSFLLCSLTLYREVNHKITKYSIPLEDGLIINKENEMKHWLIEGIIQKDFFKFFNQLKLNAEVMIAEATITSKYNPPAYFGAKVMDLKFIQEELQILLIAKRLLRKDTDSELILKDLIKKGYSGEYLFNEFKRIKTEHGEEFQSILKNDLEEMKNKNWL